MSGPTDHGAKPERERKLPHLTQADLESFVDEFGRTHYSMKDGRQVLRSALSEVVAVTVFEGFPVSLPVIP